MLNKVGKLLRLDGEYGKIIASKEHIYINGMYIQTLLDDSGSILLTKVIRDVIGTMWISKKVGETPMNVHDIVLYAPV